MTVDLAGLSVLAEQASQDSLAAHPDDLCWHTGLLGTLSLTKTGVTTLVLGLMHGLHAGSGSTLCLVTACPNVS